MLKTNTYTSSTISLIISTFALLFSTISCIKDDDYTTSTNDILAFSTDTIDFETIISGEPTKTYSFTVYNHASKAIRIPKVSLEKGASSPFNINVDGIVAENGEATDFEIAKQDSMIVYLMANTPSTDSDELVSYDDNIIFTTEAGVNQKVALKASGQDVITIRNMHISSDQTLDAKRPYRVMDSIVVNEGCKLTMAQGTKFLFHSGAQVIVKGTLNAEGTLESPVILRGDRLDNMFVNQPYDRTPGLWDGIVFKESSYNNHLQYADIHSSTNGLTVDSSNVSQRKLTIENSIIHNTSHHAVNARMSNIYIGNTQITNAGGDCLHIRGGETTLLHCTIGRFFVFTGGNGHALNFANYDGNSRLPITKLECINSIVTGYQSDEIMGSQSNDNKDDAFEYSFTNCLLNTHKPDEDSHFTNCWWDQSGEKNDLGKDALLRDKNFTPDFNLETLEFSFLPSPKSRAVGNAAPSLSVPYFNDREGVLRTPTADIGCYQHKETTEEN